MKRKIFAIFLVILFFLSSCSIRRNYKMIAYFMDSSYVVDYEASSNKLFLVKLPLDVIVSYGKENNLETVVQAIEKFTGIKADNTVVGTPGIFDSIKRILSCWAQDDSPEGLLNGLVSHAQDLSKEPLSSKINKLCSTDVSSFISCIDKENVEVVYMDCTSFLKSEDSQYNKKYFEIWFRQLLGERK